MADFKLVDKKVAEGRLPVYEGPFGPIEQRQTPEPDLTYTLTGPNVPPAELHVGAYKWLPRRVRRTRTEEPLQAWVGEVKPPKRLIAATA